MDWSVLKTAEFQDYAYREEWGKKKDAKELPYTLQAASMALPYLSRLGFIPDLPLSVLDAQEPVGDGYDEGMGGEWEIKKCHVFFEWEKPAGERHVRISLRVTLRGEFPVLPEGSPYAEKAKRRWFIVGIQICEIERQDREGPGNILRNLLFDLTGEQNIDFLFRKCDSGSCGG